MGIVPRPKGTVAKLIGADGQTGYADSTPLRTELLPEPFNFRIDAGVSVMPQNDTSYLFSNVLDRQANDDYVMVLQWDYKENKPIGDPVKVSEKWPNLPAQFGSRIDTAVNKGIFGQEIYFFSKSKWVLFDLANADVVAGPYDMRLHH